MTDASSPEIYPQYCFHLSPTVSTWCRLRARDIHGLRKHPGFEGQNVYFYGNHPVKWVRIAGVVVAVDTHIAGKRIYTVDDSSGMNIECVRNVAVPQAATVAAAAGAAAAAANQAQTSAGPNLDQADVAGEIDVGHVVDVKGSLRVWWDELQIQIEHIAILDTTEQEVRFWTKLHSFRRDVLSRPWHLEKKQIRQCRKEAEGVETGSDKKKVRKEKSSNESAAGLPRREKKTVLKAAEDLRPGGRSKRGSDPVRPAGRYDALGL